MAGMEIQSVAKHRIVGWTKILNGRKVNAMIPVVLRCPAAFALVMVMLLLGPPSARCQTEGIIPLIKLNDVPITAAIDTFARMAKFNYIVDPKLYAPPGGSNPQGMTEPKPNIDWTNISATNALIRILKENGLVMVPDKFTTITLITGTHHVANVVDASLLVSTNATAAMTNGATTPLHFWGVTLDAALKQLIELGGFNAVLDPKVHTEAGWDHHQLKIPMVASVKWGEVPTVKFHWEKLTPKQAIVALCEAYDLVIVKDAVTGVISIKPKP